MREESKIFRTEKGKEGKEPGTKKAGKEENIKLTPEEIGEIYDLLRKKSEGKEKMGTKEGLPEVDNLKLNRRGFVEIIGVLVGSALTGGIAGCLEKLEKLTEGGKEKKRGMNEEKRRGEEEEEKRKLETEKEMKEIRQALSDRYRELLHLKNETSEVIDVYDKPITGGDLGYLADATARLAADPPDLTPQERKERRECFFGNYDELLQKAKEANSKEVSGLLERLFSHPVIYPEERTEIGKISDYEIFRKMNDTEKGKLPKGKEITPEEVYMMNIIYSFSTIYKAYIRELYAPQKELDVNYATFYPGEFEPLKKSPEVRTFLEDFYSDFLKLPVPSTLKEAKK